MTSREEAKKAAETIRQICRDVYDKGLKGEDAIGPLSDIYTKSFVIDHFIDERSAPTKDVATLDPGEPSPITGA